MHLNFSGIADVDWLATDAYGLENANLQHGEIIWLNLHPCVLFTVTLDTTSYVDKCNN